MNNTRRSAGGSLSPDERAWLDRVRETSSLAALRALTDAESDHDAYLDAKGTWRRLRQREFDDGVAGTFPGVSLRIRGQEFHVHGITHADTDAEGSFLRGHIESILDDGGQVFCEQGVRQMYFTDLDPVMEIDDYRWAMHHCRQRGLSSHIDGLIQDTFEEGGGVADSVARAATTFRDLTFSVIDSGSEVYGQTFAAALGDVASSFLMDHEHLATAEDFESFELSRAAAADPSRLAALQRYYHRVFLPQPLEREWLRRHDPELELFTHARNERMAAYALSHATGSSPVHLVVGAAHQPGVLYYLSGFSDGRWDYGAFEMVP